MPSTPSWFDQIKDLTRQARADARGLADAAQVLPALVARLGAVEAGLGALEARSNEGEFAIRRQLDAIGAQQRVRSDAGEFTAIRKQLEAILAQQQAGSDAGELAAIRVQLEAIRAQQRTQFELARATFDNIRSYREQLVRARAAPGYAAVFEQTAPLISVTISTYQGSELLVERAVASVQSQTYPNWELVIVGDGCTDDTEPRIAALGDPRIRFTNLPHRGVYPAEKLHRWMVAGTPPANRAFELARGQWIAPLDHDDEFMPRHLEVLLDLALRARVELAYGKLERVGPASEAERYVYDFPPRYSQFGFQGALLRRELRFFEFDPDAWVLNEPGDWNLMRKMLAAGVLIAGTDEVVTRYHASNANLT